MLRKKILVSSILIASVIGISSCSKNDTLESGFTYTYDKNTGHLVLDASNSIPSVKKKIVKYIYEIDGNKNNQIIVYPSDEKKDLLGEDNQGDNSTGNTVEDTEYYFKGLLGSATNQQHSVKLTVYENDGKHASSYQNITSIANNGVNPFNMECDNNICHFTYTDLMKKYKRMKVEWYGTHTDDTTEFDIVGDTSPDHQYRIIKDKDYKANLFVATVDPVSPDFPSNEYFTSEAYIYGESVMDWDNARLYYASYGGKGGSLLFDVRPKTGQNNRVININSFYDANGSKVYTDGEPQSDVRSNRFRWLLNHDYGDTVTIDHIILDVIGGQVSCSLVNNQLKKGAEHTSLKNCHPI